MATSTREQCENGNRCASSDPVRMETDSCCWPSLPCMPVLRLLGFFVLCLGAISHTLIVAAMIVAIDDFARSRGPRF